MGAQVRVLFIGGTGRISSACVRRAIDVGFDVHLLTRGVSTVRPVPDGARGHRADIRDPDAVRAALAGLDFDVVANFVAYQPEHVIADLDLFRGRTGQYVFISSASAYQTPPARMPVVESMPLRNPVWPYSQDKIACEEVLVRAYRDEGYPITIVRPSHTYDRTTVPMIGGWTVVDRMRRGAEVVVHGDGTSLWTLTHHVDFARGFVGLLGHPAAFGDSFHITSDEALSWNQIVATLAAAAGVAEPRVVHVSSEAIAAADADWGVALLGDMAHTMIFDNSKVRALVPDFVATIPFHQGAREVIDWFDADPARRIVDEKRDSTMDWLVEAYRPRQR